MSKRTKARSGRNSTPEEHRVETLDQLSEFEEFKRSVAPALKAMVDKKAPPAEILETVQSLAAARLGTMVVTEKDSRRLLAVIQEILNRTVGKPTEKVEQTHKFENMKEEQLDALLKSKLGTISNDKKDDTH